MLARMFWGVLSGIGRSLVRGTATRQISVVDLWPTDVASSLLHLKCPDVV